MSQADRALAVWCIQLAYNDTIPFDLINEITEYCTNPFAWDETRCHPRVDLSSDGTIVTVNGTAYTSYGALCRAVITANSGIWAFEFDLKCPAQRLGGSAIVYLGVTPAHLWKPEHYPINSGELFFHISGSVHRKGAKGKYEALKSALGKNEETFTLTVDTRTQTVTVYTHTYKETHTLCKDGDEWWPTLPVQPFCYLNYGEESMQIKPINCKHTHF
eukprot:TRINITY_DN51409_c0_g1_i1.p1 TRINITY_DN51409_c0_g1~~TRINITY_DN51409_c0_g1_i1.p1  ORF type:complete len:217 (+),score=8.04 TRINITY_DN51409_c0_g1_i1:25-675(+)